MDNIKHVLGCYFIENLNSKEDITDDLLFDICNNEFKFMNGRNNYDFTNVEVIVHHDKTHFKDNPVVMTVMFKCIHYLIPTAANVPYSIVQLTNLRMNNAKYLEH